MALQNPFRMSSLFFVPCISEKNLAKASALLAAEDPLQHPHAIVFDLEDSVADARKGDARRNLRRFLLEDGSYRRAVSSAAVIVRINAEDTPWFQDDVAAALEVEPDFLDIPKVESPHVIDAIRKRMPTNSRFLIGIETVQGFENLPEILAAFGPNDFFVLGYEDLCAGMGIDRPKLLSDPSPLGYLVGRALVHAKSRNIAIFDGMYRGFQGDEELFGLRSECVYSRTLGFDGKVVIHPLQLPIVNTLFHKGDAEKRARHVLSLFRESGGGKAVVTDGNGTMYGPPALSSAKRVLANLGDSPQIIPATRRGAPVRADSARPVEE